MGVSLISSAYKAPPKSVQASFWKLEWFNLNQFHLSWIGCSFGDFWSQRFLEWTPRAHTVKQLEWLTAYNLVKGTVQKHLHWTFRTVCISRYIIPPRMIDLFPKSTLWVYFESKRWNLWTKISNSWTSSKEIPVRLCKPFNATWSGEPILIRTRF